MRLDPTKPAKNFLVDVRLDVPRWLIGGALALCALAQVLAFLSR